ncbi:hypothetical protein J6590_004358 [Homalodisca vitripennis]|nr:hypothetical protein J6590_004358 [Homalodisca vitripennis]
MREKSKLLRTPCIYRTLAFGECSNIRRQCRVRDTSHIKQKQYTSITPAEHGRTLGVRSAMHIRAANPGQSHTDHEHARPSAPGPPLHRTFHLILSASVPPDRVSFITFVPVTYFLHIWAL